jgi:flagellar protein FlaJ
MGLFGDRKKEKISVDPKSEEIYSKIETYYHYSEGTLRFIKHPFRTLFEKPINILYVSVPAGLLFFIVGLMMALQNGGPGALLTNSFIDDVAVFTTVIIVGPLAVTDLLEGRRITSIEIALPNFFRDLAGMHESGMTLPGAIHLVSQAEYGALTRHIRQLDQRISWNFAFIDAIRQLGKEIPIPLVERSVDLVARASDAGGDIVEVLRADRKNNMFIYVIIILASFAVFLFVVMILVSSFLKTMADLGAETGASGQAGFNLGGFDLALYIRVFSHAGMFQGFFSGLVAGVMGEGRVTAGLKYSVLMLLIAWVTFRFMV